MIPLVNDAWQGALLGDLQEEVGEECAQEAEVVGVEPGKTYLTMRILNPQGLVAQDKGAGIAWATNMLMPQFIEKTIYEKVGEELSSQFEKKGSKISVEIVSTPPKGTPPKSDLFGGIFLGVLLSALGYGAIKLAGGLGKKVF